MAEMDFIAPPKHTTIDIDLAPVYNVLTSLAMLNDVDMYPGMDSWSAETAAALPPKRMHTNRLVFGPLNHAATRTDGAWASFPAYIDALADEAPGAMQARALAFCDTCEGEFDTLDAETVLADREAYLAFVEHKYRQKDALDHFDRDLYVEAHTLFNNPPALHAVVVEHLRVMWDTVMAETWAQAVPMVRESAEALRKSRYLTLSLPEAFRAITGRPIPEVWQDTLDKAERVTFMPSPHLGPYLYIVSAHMDSGPEAHALVGFGARLPEGAAAGSPTFSRSELLVRLEALADDTRLRILGLLQETGAELRAQDFIDRLDLSQSAASRHLRHLVATGFLSERRHDGAKCYRLNHDRVDDACQALTHLLGAKHDR
jgi:DNA-binding transcriptional ArsR family regulator